MIFEKKILVTYCMALISITTAIGQTKKELGQLKKELKQLSTKLYILNAKIEPPVLHPNFIELPFSMQWLAQDPATHLYQIKVLQQADQNANPKLPKDDDAHNGYHAVKNGIYILDAIKSEGLERIKFLEGLIDPITYMQLLIDSDWQNVIRQGRYKDFRASKIITYEDAHGYKDTQGVFHPPKILTKWLRKDDIENLIKNLSSGLFVSSLTYTIRDKEDRERNVTPKDYFTVLINKNLKKEPLLPQLIKDFKENPTFTHVIILGLADQYPTIKKEDVKPWESSLQWLIIAINKVNGVVQYLIMDSMNKDRTKVTGSVLKFIKILEGKNNI